MTKIYIAIPVVLTLIFGAYYWNFDSNYAADIAAREAIVQAEEKVRIAREVEIRNKAVKDAVAAQAIREKDKAEKEKLETERTAARQLADEQRTTSFELRRKNREQAERLRKELETAKIELARLVEQKRQLQQEQVFLAEFVKKAEANAQYYLQLIDKVESAEKARTAAEAAAAAAARKG